MDEFIVRVQTKVMMQRAGSSSIKVEKLGKLVLGGDYIILCALHGMDWPLAVNVCQNHTWMFKFLYS